MGPAEKARISKIITSHARTRSSAESWTALVDPEDNEFCVVRPKETVTG